jgi:hypothetical protein
MTFNITDTIFSIRKTQKEIIRDWIMFVLGATAIYGILLMGYYIFHMPLKVEYLILLFITCFGTMFLINRTFLRPCTIEIRRINERYHLGDKHSFSIREEKKIRIDDRYGEMAIRAIGNMYLRIGSRKFILCYGVSEKEMFEIKKNLEIFFSEELMVEYKTKYW